MIPKKVTTDLFSGKLQTEIVKFSKGWAGKKKFNSVISATIDLNMENALVQYAIKDAQRVKIARLKNNKMLLTLYSLSVVFKFASHSVQFLLISKAAPN